MIPLAFGQHWIVAVPVLQILSIYVIIRRLQGWNTVSSTRPGNHRAFVPAGIGRQTTVARDSELTDQLGLQREQEPDEHYQFPANDTEDDCRALMADRRIVYMRRL